jgi:aspartyl protease
MLIAGEWKLCDDGVTRPVVRANVVGADEIPYAEDFLVDTGADRTVFSATLLVRLRLPTRSPLTGTALSGIGGERVFVMVTTRVEFLHDDGRLIRIHGEFASFTDPAATDLSILGRDVLDNFDLIVSRRRNHVLLLAPRHQYRVARG